jgi:hypothetical protein
MHRLKTITLGFFFFLSATSLMAQYGSVGFGFKTGLNFSRIDGPSEIGPNGEALESNSNTSGFHIGALVNFKFTDLVGIRTELTYSQRGTKYEYNGPSYFKLGQHTVQNLTLTGTRIQTLEVTNAYIDIPVQAYYKFGSFEIFGGVNASLLVSSIGGGNIQFNGIAPVTQTPVNEFNVTLIHNYKSDAAMGASTDLQQVNVSGQNYNVPEDTGAYYDFLSKDKNLYETLDLGLTGGVSYFLNSSLFLSARYILGLRDVDRNEYDVSLQSLQNNNLVYRADKNKSHSIQVSVGFSF